MRKRAFGVAGAAGPLPVQGLLLHPPHVTLCGGAGRLLVGAAEQASASAVLCGQSACRCLLRRGHRVAGGTFARRRCGVGGQFRFARFGGTCHAVPVWGSLGPDSARTCDSFRHYSNCFSPCWAYRPGLPRAPPETACSERRSKAAAQAHSRSPDQLRTWAFFMAARHRGG